MVWLKELLMPEQQQGPQRFNSIMVWLKDPEQENNILSHDRFNSIMVWLKAYLIRLKFALPFKFQFHYGLIKRVQEYGIRH